MTFLFPSFCRYSIARSARFSLGRSLRFKISTHHATRRNMSTLPRYPIFEALTKHDPEKTAVVHSVSGRSYSYGQLVGDISSKTKQIALDAGRSEGQLKGERVALLIENGYDYVGRLLQSSSTVCTLSDCLSESPLHHRQRRNRCSSLPHFPRRRATLCPRALRGIDAPLLCQIRRKGSRDAQRRTAAHSDQC